MIGKSTDFFVKLVCAGQYKSAPESEKEGQRVIFRCMNLFPLPVVSNPIADFRSFHAEMIFKTSLGIIVEVASENVEVTVERRRHRHTSD
jgi:hypothetical protein